LRARYPTVTVADVYEYPRLADLARRLDEFEPTSAMHVRAVAPTPRSAQAVQTLAALPLAALVGLRWLTWLIAVDAVLGWTGAATWVPPVPHAWWWVALGWLVLVSPFGRMGTTVLVARTLLRGLTPGRH